MNTLKKCIVQMLCLVVVMLASVEQGFGQSKLLTVDNPIRNKYIVVLNDYMFRNQSNLSVDSTARNLAVNHNGQIGFVYESAIKGFSIEMSKEAATALSRDARVKYVTEDNEVSLSDTQFNAP